MKYLIRQQQQKRVKFSGEGQEGKEIFNHSTREKRSQNWFERQFSSKMSRDFDSEDSDHATAIAAATFAIYSADEARLRQKQRINVQEGFKSTTSRGNATKEDTTWVSEPSGDRRFSRNETKGREASMRKPTSREEKSLSNVRSGLPRTRDEMLTRNSTRGRSGETKVEAWERAEGAKIQKRYEKISSNIIAWENKKKTKAKLQMERKKGELERKRAINSQHYQSKLDMIDNIAGGARAQLEEKKKNEYRKLQEKANKMRSSGKSPTCCLCF